MRWCYSVRIIPFTACRKIPTVLAILNCFLIIFLVSSNTVTKLMFFHIDMITESFLKSHTVCQILTVKVILNHITKVFLFSLISLLGRILSFQKMYSLPYSYQRTIQQYLFYLQLYMHLTVQPLHLFPCN